MICLMPAMFTCTCVQVSVGGIIMLRDCSDGAVPEELIEPIKGVYSVLGDHVLTSVCVFLVTSKVI